MEKNSVDMMTKVVLRAMFIGIALWLLFLVRDILALFVLSVVFTATLDPAIDRIEKKGLSRTVAVFFVYVFILVALGIFISLIAPPLVSQFKDFSKNLPLYADALTHAFGGLERYVRSYGFNFDSKQFLDSIFGGLDQSSGQIFSTTVSVFHAFISIIVVLSLTFYMSVKEEGVKGALLSLTPRKHREYVGMLAGKIQRRIGRWMFGQILLMVIIFVLDFIALSIFNVPYALILALLAGILEIVPYLGPIISTTLAALVGFLISPLTGVIVLATCTVIQQIESHVIVPQIMRKAVGLNPVVVILALLVGARLGGTLGAILSIPIATAIGIVVMDIVDKSE